MKDREWVAICRRQREAYQAWQADPQGYSGAAFQSYLAASKAYDEFFKAAKEVAKES